MALRVVVCRAALAAAAVLLACVSRDVAGADGGMQFFPAASSARPMWKAREGGRVARRGGSTQPGISTVRQAAWNGEPGESGESTGTGGLKWKPRWPSASSRSRNATAGGHSQATLQQTAAEQPVKESPLDGEPTLRLEGPQVRRAAEIEQLDPLHDPFGDKLAQQEPGAPPMRLDPALPMRAAPSDDAAGGLSLPPGTDEPRSSDSPAAPGTLPGFQPDFQPTPRPFPEDDRTKDLPEGPFSEQDCRNPANCYVPMKTLQQLGTKFLDITPGLEPNEPDPEGLRREKYLSTTESHVWKDRDGNIIGQGRLVDFEQGRLIIEPASGGRLLRVPFEDLGNDDLCYFTSWWRLPQECTLGDEKFAGRNWMAMSYTWTASGVCYKPLYFQEYALERYGHTVGPLAQQALSGAHFFLNIAILPYKMGINPPNECRYPLGYYRPGNCAPWLLDPIPFSLRGALYQAGAVVLGITAIP